MLRGSLASLAAAVVVTLFATTARAAAPPPEWSEGAPVPPAYEIVSLPRQGLIIAGTVTASTAYAVALLTSFISPGCADTAPPDCTPSPHAAAIPVAGPFVAAATHDGRSFAPVLVVEGAAQVVGLALVGAAFVWPTKAIVPQRRAAMSVTPWVGPGGAGLRGSF